ncbi:hypothetical protein TNCV_2409791 [Trichonephila clavipes]|nr:hypothetical protein TNCV_2409791 [Trichonephila clavipes]
MALCTHTALTCSVTKSPRVAEQCDVNIHSLTHTALMRIHFEHRSSNEHNIRASTPLSKLPIPIQREDFEPGQIYHTSVPLHDGSSVPLGFEPTSARL